MFANVLLSFNRYNPKLNANMKQTSHVMNLIVFFMIVRLDIYKDYKQYNRINQRIV